MGYGTALGVERRQEDEVKGRGWRGGGGGGGGGVPLCPSPREVANGQEQILPPGEEQHLDVRSRRDRGQRSEERRRRRRRRRRVAVVAFVPPASRGIPPPPPVVAVVAFVQERRLLQPPCLIPHVRVVVRAVAAPAAAAPPPPLVREPREDAVSRVGIGVRVPPGTARLLVQTRVTDAVRDEVLSVIFGKIWRSAT